MTLRDEPRTPGGRNAGPLVAASAAAAALAVNLPLLGPGFVLTYDMVFVPRPRLGRELLGVSRELPRSVPTEAIVALLSRVVTGQVVQKAVLLAIVALAVLGMAWLLRGLHPAARIGAGLLYIWNPATYERLLLGQWAFLLGYALLPFVAAAAVSVRAHRSGAGPRLVLALAAATAASPYTGLFGLALAAAMLLWPARETGGAGATPRGTATRRALVLLALGVAVNLPWVVPAAFHGDVPDRPAAAAEAFKARSDSPLGTAGSVLSLGGVWSSGFAPPGRDAVWWLPALALIAGLGAWGAPAAFREMPRGTMAGLAALAAAGLFLAIAPSVPGLREIPRLLGAHVPGGGILRDAQKFAAFYALLLAACFGHGVQRVVDRLPATDSPRRPPAMRAGVVLTALAVLPVALAPAVAWAASGRLFTSDYPPSWSRADRQMADDPASGAVLVLPWEAYVPFGWNRGRAVLNPAAQFFSRPAVVDGTLHVGRFVLPAEDPWSRLVAPTARGGRIDARVARLGIRYVLAFSEPGSRAAAERIGLPRVLRTPDLELFRVGGAVRLPSFDQPPLVAVLAADAVALAIVAGAAVRAFRGRPRDRDRPR